MACESEEHHGRYKSYDPSDYRESFRAVLSFLYKLMGIKLTLIEKVEVSNILRQQLIENTSYRVPGHPDNLVLGPLYKDESALTWSAAPPTERLQQGSSSIITALI